MKQNLGCLIGISLFLGFVLVGAAIGSIFPSILRVSAPIVCNGEMVIEIRQYSYRPGEVTSQNNFYCIDKITGEKRGISALTYVTGCLIYSCIIFLLFYAINLAKRLKRKQPELPRLATSLTASPPVSAPFVETKSTSANPGERLKELKELREADLISEQEYAAKKAEILSRM